MKNDSDFISCDSARLEASAWIDGERPASSALASHLEGCAECRTHVEDMRAMSARLAPLRVDGPVADLWPGIAARTRARPTSVWNQPARRIAAALIGCAVTAALLEAASHLGRAPRDGATAVRALWPSALHQEPAAALEFRSAPEQRLLASIDPRQKGQ